MAFFNYDLNYTPKELYDWVIGEIAVAKQLNLSSLTTFLEIFQAQLNKKNVDNGKPLWIPTLPSEATVRKIKERMLAFSRKVMGSVDKGRDNLGDAVPVLAFTGQSGKCPECLEFKAHLKAHLMSSRHKWTERHYNTWKSDVPPKQQPTKNDKNCHYVSPDHGIKCAWRGERLDMHLKRRHTLKVEDHQYRDLISKGKDARPTSTTTNNTTSTTSARPSTTRRSSIASASPQSDAPLMELLARPRSSKRRLIESSHEEVPKLKGKKRKISKKYFSDESSSDEGQVKITKKDLKDALATVIPPPPPPPVIEQESPVLQKAPAIETYLDDKAEDDEEEGSTEEEEEGSTEEEDEEEEEDEDEEEDDEEEEEGKEEEGLESLNTDAASGTDDGRGEFGKDFKPNNTIEVLIKGFNYYMTTPDGGCKENHQIKQRCGQVRCQESRYHYVKEPSFNMF